MPRKKATPVKKRRYYSLDKILATNSTYNLVFGMRGNGKSYSVLKHCLHNYKNTGKQFVYIRRWKEDITGFKTETIFVPLDEEIKKLFGPTYTIYYYRRQFFLCEEDDEGNRTNKTLIGYALALSENHHTKSTSYPLVNLILFDEFIQMEGETRLPAEVSKFENTISTICRDRPGIKIFMLGNTVSKFSPYFSYFKIDVNSIEQGQIKIFERPTSGGVQKIACEYTEAIEDLGDRNSMYVMSKMITSGQWEIPTTDDIPTAVNENFTERLLFSAYDPEAELNIGVYLHFGTWESLDIIQGIATPVKHEHEFLVIRQVAETVRSSYFHLTNQKSLKQTDYHQLTLMLKDILELTEIDVERELKLGRVYSDNMFTADYFNHIWDYYSAVKIRQLL